MAKFRMLKGIAHDLADSFISPTNMELIHSTDKLEKNLDFKLELLTGKATTKPKVEVTYNYNYYKDWFYEQLKKAGIEEKDIEAVLIEVKHRWEVKETRSKNKMITSVYNCTVSIKTKDKEYKKEVKSSWLL